jgi:hypothetical protein
MLIYLGAVANDLVDGYKNNEHNWRNAAIDDSMVFFAPCHHVVE